MTPAEADRYIQRILTNALTAHARYHAAVGHLRDSTSEHRPNASGSDTGGGGDKAGDTTGPTETAALNHLNGRPDRARQAFDWIHDELRKADHHLGNLERHITANWIPGSPHGTEADAITRRLDDLWCANHRRHGVYEPRLDDRTLCRWCSDTKQAVRAGGCGHLPDAELIEARSRRGRLTTRDYDQFITRQTTRRRTRKGAA